MADFDDPFKPMQAAQAPGEPPSMIDASIARGKPKKNLMIFGVIAGVALVVAWMVWPHNKYAKKPHVVAQSGTMTAQEQSNAGSSLMRQLQQQASAAQPAIAASSPRPSIVPAAPIVPLPYQAASGASVGALTPEEKAKQRQDLIWSSSPSVAGVKTMNQGKESQVGASNASLSPLEAAKLALAQAMPTPASMPAITPAAAATSDTSPNSRFLADSASNDVPAPLQEQGAYARSVLLQGTVIRAVTLSGINTDLPGSITAKVVSNVYDTVHPSRLLIPKGSTLIGRYSSDFKIGQSRVLVAMTRLILPDGQWISLAGTPATDTQGMSGMPADVNNHFIKIFGSSLIIGATSLLLPTSQQNITITSPTSGGSQEGGTIFAQSLQQTVQQLLQRNLSIQPTGTVQPGTPFDFMVSRDMLMNPYQTGQ